MITSTGLRKEGLGVVEDQHTFMYKCLKGTEI